LVVTDWADSLLKNSKDKDIIVVGDFNDSPKRKKNSTLDVMQELLWIITADMKSCKFPSAYVIDHVAASDIASDRFIPDSEYSENITSVYSKKELALISDHCPITVKFEVKSPDNDPVKPLAKK
jgi:endonuclease/exonuclease/phosphatase family metal-dependent hydrolase